MTQEEKAKAYDEAVKVAKSKIKNDKDHVLYEDDVIEMFPELKEPEDERIRKEMIEVFKSLGDGKIPVDINYADIFTWLKRQGDKFQYWKPSEEQLEAIDYAYNLCPDTEMGNYYEGVLETLIDDLHKLSEKQDENKPADKIEPIFKVGDTIHCKEENTTFPMVIDRISGGYYECNGGRYCVNFKFQDCYELVKQTATWSEEDEDYYDAIIAKLEVTQDDASLTDNQMEFLKSLKYRVQLQPKQELSKEDEIAIDDAIWCCEKAASIAKDENDMGNAWYAEHWLKTLKYKTHSLPQQEWSKKDDYILNNICHFVSENLLDKNKCACADECLKWLKSFKDKVQLQPKHELAEEDVAYINSLCDVVKDSRWRKEDKVSFINWLKSLKDKVRPQPKQEWSEEVEATIRLLKGIAEEQEKDYCPYNANNLRKAAQYLETCRPQSTWKPSNEQLEALEHSLGDYNITVFEDRHKILTSLYQDLKKLKKLKR